MDSHPITPIFIFSLPRSGSTYLQWLLGNHPLIHTVSEPWILLPIVRSLNKVGTYSNYSHLNASIATNEFIQNFINDENDFFDEIRCFVLSIYQRITSQQNKRAIYFIDKTPRYHLIINEIHKIFPDAKFIYLVRNPLSIIASMVNTIPRNVWSLYFYNVDLFEGLNNFIANYIKYSPFSISVKYENLVNNPNFEIGRILKYLNIKENHDFCSPNKNIELRGSMGDKLTHEKGYNLRKQSIKKWKKTINNPVRKFWCRRYLNWIGKDRMRILGYSFEQLNNELSSVKSKFNSQMIKDTYQIIFGLMYTIFEYTIVKENIKKIRNAFQISAKT